MYHTHGADDPGFDNENFSPTDKRRADKEMRPNILGTPNRAIKIYTPTSPVVIPGGGTVNTIGITR
jgi:hypothetical protein